MTENQRGIGHDHPESAHWTGVIGTPTPGFTAGKRENRIC
jgi:hypothetical protein